MPTPGLPHWISERSYSERYSAGGVTGLTMIRVIEVPKGGVEALLQPGALLAAGAFMPVAWGGTAVNTVKSPMLQAVKRKQQAKDAGPNDELILTYTTVD